MLVAHFLQFYGGLNSHLEWKGLSFDVLFSYTISRKVMNMYKNSAFTFTKDFGVIMNYFHAGDFWTTSNRDAKVSITLSLLIRIM